MRNTEPVQQPLSKEVTVLPPIPTMGGWSDLAGAFASAEPKLEQDADDPFADPDSMLEKKPPGTTRLSDEPPRTQAIRRVRVPSAVLLPTPTPTLDPFADPPALVSTSPDSDGPSRLSKGSMYDESIARASMSSSHVRSHLCSPSSMTI